MKTMKKAISLLIILFITAVLFFLIHILTPAPGQTSGNGNIALIIMLPLPVLFVLLIVRFNALLKPYLQKYALLVLGLLLSATHILLASLYQRTIFQLHLQVLEQAHLDRYGYIDAQYLQSITGLFSIHVNSAYFNINTYLIFLSMALFVSLLILILKLRRNKT